MRSFLATTALAVTVLATAGATSAQGAKVVPKKGATIRTAGGSVSVTIRVSADGSRLDMVRVLMSGVCDDGGRVRVMEELSAPLRRGAGFRAGGERISIRGRFVGSRKVKGRARLHYVGRRTPPPGTGTGNEAVDFRCT